MTNTSRRTRPSSGVVAAVVAVALAIALVVGVMIQYGIPALANFINEQNQLPTASAPPTESPTPEPSDEPSVDPDLAEILGGDSSTDYMPHDQLPLSSELIERLDVSAVTTSSICLGIIDKYGQIGDEANRNSNYEDTYALFLHVLQNTPPKHWSDALSIAFAGKDLTNEDLLGLVKRAICEEPVIGSTFMYMMTHNQINGIDLVDLQKTDWADEIANTDIDDLDEFIQQFVPLAFADQHKWMLTKEGQYRLALAANHEYLVFASKAVFLLSRYEFVGLLTNVQSTTTYHLVNGGLTADGIPEIEVAENEKLPGLWFYLTEKGVCKPISVVGFNLYDKRPELGVIPADCESLTPPPPPRGGCVINCGSSDCVVDCGLDLKTDPVPSEGTGETGEKPVTVVDTPKDPVIVVVVPVTEADGGGAGEQDQGGGSTNNDHLTE